MSLVLEIHNRVRCEEMVGGMRGTRWEWEDEVVGSGRDKAEWEG